MFRFLYFSGLVRRNSFVNVVFAVCECGELGVRNGVFVFVFGLFVLECGGCRGRNGIRRRGRGGTFLFFGCWKGRESVGLGLGGWKSDVIGRFFVVFFGVLGGMSYL